jgi:hypothetical protein
MIMTDNSWADVLVRTLIDLGGEGHLGEITKLACKYRKAAGYKVPKHADAVVRGVLEDHCPDTSFRSGVALFYHDGLPAGVRNGVYGLRAKVLLECLRG